MFNAQRPDSKGIVYAWKPLIVTQHLTDFNGFKPSGSRDIVYLYCHAIFQDSLIKGSCDFMEESFSFYVTIVPCLMVIGILVVEI